MIQYNRIQYLRCFAASAVVLFHSFGTCQKYFGHETYLTILGYGDYGVDLFFVISGFIIAISTLKRDLEWRIFLKRRLERIVPLYWLLTLIMFLLMAYFYRGTPDVPSLASLMHSLLYISWFDAKLPIIYPGWTLEYEMAFYLLVSITMALSGRTWPSVILAITICVCFGLLITRLGINSSQILFITNPMYLEFALGIVIAHVTLGRPLPLMSVAGLFVAFGLIILFGALDEWRWRVLVAGLPASIVVFCAAWIDQRNLPLSRLGQIFVKLGDASYSIYLVQAFVISIACKVLASIVPGLSLDIAISVVSIVTLVVACVVHHTVERPITQWLHRERLALKPDMQRYSSLQRKMVDATSNPR